MNVNNLEITMATFALNPIQFVSIPLVPTNVSNQSLSRLVLYLAELMEFPLAFGSPFKCYQIWHNFNAKRLT